MNAQSQSGGPTQAVFRTPFGPRALTLAIAVISGCLTVFLTVMAVLVLRQQQWAFGTFAAALACFEAGLTAYVTRDLRGKWGLRVALKGRSLVLDLPAGRSLIHRPPAYHQEIAYADIEAIETRLEGYRTLKMAMMQRPYVLHRKNGELIFLFEDRAIGTPYETSLFSRIVAQIGARASVPLLDLGMVEGDGGVLGVWGTHAPDWATPVLPSELQSRTWRAVMITGALPIPVIAIALMIRLLMS